MDRLTHKADFGGYYIALDDLFILKEGQKSNIYIKDPYINRLGFYEDAEEQGRLIVLPCKVGDTVWKLDKGLCPARALDLCNTYCDGWGSEKYCHEGTILPRETVFSLEMLGQIGKTVFLTREEAEAALESR